MSILTIVRDRKESLPGTIRSVLSQTYPNVEYVVVDGASADGTLDVIREFDDRIDLWISEPDRGTSDAINKAISLAQGEYVSWLAAGDRFDADFIDVAVKALQRSGADFVFGDLRIYKGDTLVQTVKGDRESLDVPARVTSTSPTMVTRRTCFQDLGLFDSQFRIRNDFDWILRLHRHGGQGCYDSRLVAHFTLGGASDSGGDFTHIFEDLKILKRHRLLTARVAAPYLYRLMRYSIGDLARLLLPDSVHRTLKRVMGRGHRV